MHLPDAVWRCINALPRVKARFHPHSPIHGVHRVVRHAVYRVAVKAPMMAWVACKYVMVAAAVLAPGPVSPVPSDFIAHSGNPDKPVTAGLLNDRLRQVAAPGNPGDPAYAAIGEFRPLLPAPPVPS